MAELYRKNIADVDIGKPLKRENAGVLLASGDKYANRFGAILHRDGVPVDMAGQAVTVTGYFVRPDGKTVVCEGVQDGNMVYVDLPAACYAHSGAFSLAIKVSGTEITETVRVIDGVIRLTHTDTIVDPGEVVPSLDDLLGCVEQMQMVANSTATPIVTEASGDTVSIADAAARDAQSVVTHINVVQAGEGTPSADNARPIVPVGSVSLWHGDVYDEAAVAAKTVALPDGVYGGHYDWVTGVLTLTFGVVTLTGSGFTWQTGMGNFYTAIAGRADKATLYCDRYVQIGNAEGIQPGQMALGARNNNVCFGTALTMAEWKAALDAEPLVVFYELAEPTLVQLDPHRVAMLEGNNALWSDTGSTSVSYIVDTKQYIDNKFTALQNAILAQGANV